MRTKEGRKPFWIDYSHRRSIYTRERSCQFRNLYFRRSRFWLSQRSRCWHKLKQVLAVVPVQQAAVRRRAAAPQLRHRRPQALAWRVARQWAVWPWALSP